MNTIDRILLKKGERALLPFRYQNTVLIKPEFEEYSTYLPIIKSCYEQVGYWHGTGRYQYSHSEYSRYENINFNILVDVLDSVLQKNTMRPHHEPWLKKIQGMNIATISLTPYRMYARLYAELYQYEKDSLSYQFGTTKLWHRLLRVVQFFDKKFLWFLMTKGMFKLINITTYKNIKQFLSSIRKNNRSIYLLQSHLIRSDILGNYPILFGIKQGIETLSLNSGLERLETRTSRAISLIDITHIEVPLNKVNETKILLKKYGTSLCVIPLEFCELYCSTLPLSQLVGIT